MLVYVAGCYRAKGDRTVVDHIAEARRVSIQLWEAGLYVLCPHLTTAHFEDHCQIATDQQFLDGTLEMMRRCDAVVMLENWLDSEGAIAEHDYAKAVGIPVYYYPNYPSIPLTEQRCPEQCKAFMDVIMKMYRVHLSKNADYSPANILGTGEVGLITRLWDKIARLLNLYGFELRMEKAEFTAARSPKHESIDDTYCDLSVYGVIGQLLRMGKWGH